MCLDKVTHKWLGLPSIVIAHKVFRTVLDNDPMLNGSLTPTPQVGDLLSPILTHVHGVLPRGQWIPASTTSGWQGDHWVNYSTNSRLGKLYDQVFGHAYKVGWHAFKTRDAALNYRGGFHTSYEVVLPVRLRSLTAVGTYRDIVDKETVGYVAHELYIPTVAELADWPNGGQ